MHRITRIAALSAAVAAAALTVGAGTASAGGYGDEDQRCKNAEGVIVVCTADELVDLDNLDVDVNILNHEHGHGDGYWLPVHGPDLR